MPQSARFGGGRDTQTGEVQVGVNRTMRAEWVNLLVLAATVVLPVGDPAGLSLSDSDPMLVTV